jgi:transglutaminase-like putative cysteine protease
MIAFMGWYNEDDRDVARHASCQALERWIDLGLAFRSAQDGRRYFDPVEANNFMRRAASDDFYSKRFVPALRRLVSDARSDAPLSKPERRFAIDFERTFDLQSVPVGTKVRLRAPLPRIGRTFYDLDVRPYAPSDPDVRLVRSDGRLEARGLVPVEQTMSLGARLQFSAKEQHLAERLDEPPDENLADYLREREGLVVVTARIAGLAASVTARSASACEAIRSLWLHICREIMLGSLHYDQIDVERPCDWALDSGWVDCRLAASLFVAMCRARRIPARVLGGYLVYPRACMAHYWAEVWIEGRGWAPIDFLGWDLGDAGRDAAWRDRFFGTIDCRLTTERLPREFTGAIGVPIPNAWSLLQTSDERGSHLSLLDSGGSAIYVDTLRVEELTPP